MKYEVRIMNNGYKSRIIKYIRFLILNSGFLILDSGFTLIELLVVVALIGVLGTVTTQVFILGMQSQGKTEVIKEVKQNGDFALSVMESTIRNAENVVIADTDCNNNLSPPILTIVNSDGSKTKFDCNTSGKILVTYGTLSGPTPTAAPLTGSRTEVSDCHFRVVCPNPPVSPKYVFLSYTVSLQTGTVKEPKTSSSLEYQTTVSLRNF